MQDGQRGERSWLGYPALPGILEERLLLTSLLVQLLIGLDDVENTGAIWVLGCGVFDIWP
jgi:hypothetical protein